jgi:2-amino-4-hydroxy-6-hydroxymethyldihydropteridine diphosphokinase
VSTPSVIAFVGLGSNLGDREAQLAGAVRALASTPEVEIGAGSRVFETEAVGPAGQGHYLNAVLQVTTRLPPRVLLDRLLAIERAAGRVREQERVRWGPRCLDLDLLLYGALCLRELGIEIPHPRLHERGFVLEPLCDLAPGLIHPGLGRSLADLARLRRDEGSVRVFGTRGLLDAACAAG